jgi:hypothetical protein
MNEQIKNDSDTLFYSKSNKFYNDICFTYSNDSYDILLEDRYEIFHNNSNYQFCENNCNVTNINITNFRVECSCSNIINSFQNYGIYKEKKIIHDKNFQFLKCSKLFSKKDLFKKNYGNYIILFFLISQIICFIIIYHKGLDKINLLSIDNKKNKEDQNNSYDEVYISSNPPKTQDNRVTNENEIIINNDDDNKQNNYYIYKSGQAIEKYCNTSKRKDRKTIERKTTNKEVKNNNEEKNEPKTLLTIFWENIQNKHKIISLFYNCKYGIDLYKLTLLILTITLDLLFCCLFDFSSNISELYHKYKKFTGKEILIGFYSLIPSYIITKLIDFFIKYGLEDKKSNNDNLNEKYKKIKWKFIFYSFLTFTITIISWYIVSLFCLTYPNTIINLILCFFCNLVLSFIIPFIYYFLVSLFESIVKSRGNKKCNKISTFLLKL